MWKGETPSPEASQPTRKRRAGEGYPTPNVPSFLSPATHPNSLTSGCTSSPLGSTPQGRRTASQLTRRPVTSGGCRETVSVTSSCTHPLPLPSTRGPASLPPSLGSSRSREAAGPSVSGWLPSCPLRPHTVVGKSRTTGSHDLTSVSSTIAKNGGEASGSGWARGAEGAQRPLPLLRKRPGELAWSEAEAVQQEAVSPRPDRTRSPPSRRLLWDGDGRWGGREGWVEGTHRRQPSGPSSAEGPVPAHLGGTLRAPPLQAEWTAWAPGLRELKGAMLCCVPNTPCHCLI